MPRSNGAADATWHMPVVLRTANDRFAVWAGGACLDRYPWRSLVGQDVGYVSPRYPFINGGDQNSFGNLECSPPVVVGGRTYPFGRIVYGTGHRRGMDSRVRQFLEAQKVQKPFSVDTGWLKVGHVDEVFSFCPMPNAPKQFKVLLASASVAMDIIRERRAAAGHGNDPIVNHPNGVQDPPYSWQTVDEVLNDADFCAVQNRVQSKINNVKKTLKKKLGLDNDDFIHLPVLFREHDPAPNRTYIAYTANCVNMLVVTKANEKANLCIPKPYGVEVGGNCLFEQDIEAKLQPDYPGGAADAGCMAFIDDFHTYHVQQGEIHCGTNEIREPPTDDWWWELDWI
jgi:protein-arginine deiminase